MGKFKIFDHEKMKFDDTTRIADGILISKALSY